MRMGLFGKLQSKRDFIALATPRAFLAVWEPWLQGGISASRHALEQNWQNAFLTAPIWRFWLGTEICGTTVAGAIMPSMDGVGRYFPLTAAAFAEAGEHPPPPEIDVNEVWYTAIEDFLFSTLDAGRSFEEVTEALAALPAACASAMDRPASLASLQPYPGLAVRGGDFAAAFAQTRRADHGAAYAGMSFWWTTGGKDFAPLAIACPRMPDPQLYATMLTGQFADASPEPDRVS